MALTTSDLDNALDPLQEEYIDPTGAKLLALVHSNMIHNFLRDKATRLDLPSYWRLAKLATNGDQPLIVLSSTQLINN